MDCEMECEQQKSLKEVTPSPRVSSTTVLLILNSILLTALLVVVGAAYHDMQAKTKGLTEIVNIFQSPTPSPKIIAATSRVLRGVADEFFLGAFDGQVSDFFTKVFTYDFGSVGRNLTALSQSVEYAFRNRVEPTSCYLPMVCRSYGYFNCTNGRVVYCNQAGEIINCAKDSCIGDDIAAGASMIGSITANIGKFQQVYGQVYGSPALSDGLFRLDGLFTWINAQANRGDWNHASQICLQFTNQIRGLPWSGSYTDKNGFVKSWNVKNHAVEITQYVDQVCSGLAIMQKLNKAQK
jgi:hypothetical protein